MPDCTSADAERVVQRLIEEFSSLELGVTFSTGIVQNGPMEFLEADECIRRADEKMYKSKTQQGFFITV